VRAAVLLSLVVACTREPGVRVTLAAPRATPKPPPAVRVEPDWLHCPLRAETYELGDAGAGAPSAPAALGDGFVVAYAVVDGARYAAMAQTFDAGRLGDPVALGAARTTPPVLVAARAPLAIVADGDAPALRELGPRKWRLPMPEGAWPDDATMGPRGLLTTYLNVDERVLIRDGRVLARFRASRSYPMPLEQVLASGPEADVVVLREAPFRVGVVTPGGATAEHDLHAPAFVDASVAAGPRGFMVVGDGPSMTQLTVVPLDPRGAPSPPVDLPPTRDGKVARFPRVAAVARGWVATYWDGVGPSLVRFDGSGRETAPPIELRTGDERGGQTEARIAVGPSAIAVTWNVNEPWFGHGVADEVPKHPGPRLAILTCR